MNQILLLALILTIISCDDDDGPAYEFIDQNLQGQINGRDWSFVEGKAEVSFSDNTKLSIELGAQELEDACDAFLLEGMRVFFLVDNKVGLTELKFSFDEEGQTITLYDPDEPVNIITTAGGQ